MTSSGFTENKNSPVRYLFRFNKNRTAEVSFPFSKTSALAQKKKYPHHGELMRNTKAIMAVQFLIHTVCIISWYNS